jgi:hypothetical protein
LAELLGRFVPSQTGRTFRHFSTPSARFISLGASIRFDRVPPFAAAVFHSRRTPPMRLFMFKSESNRDLHAFTAHPAGEPLPSRHGPWTAVGVVREDKEPPHKLSREAIEQSIADQGFQLYRMKRAAA